MQQHLRIEMYSILSSEEQLCDGSKRFVIYIHAYMHTYTCSSTCASRCTAYCLLRSSCAMAPSVLYGTSEPFSALVFFIFCPFAAQCNAVQPLCGVCVCV